jgi:hypothetical protein
MVSTRKKSDAHRAAERRIRELQAQLAEMEKQNQVAEKENQDQQRQVDPDPNKRPTKKSKQSNYVAKIHVSKDLEARIPEVAGPKGPNLWRTTKFLNGEEDLIKATAQIMGDIPDCKKYLEEPDVNLRAENILAFKETYGHLICKAINDGRNNTQSGLKMAYIERYDDKLPMPDPIQIVLVILREDLELPKKPKEPKHEDYEDPSLFETARTKYETRLAKYEERYAEVKQNREWFKWYWLALLPKVCGNKRWGATIRQYGLICEHAPIENPKQKYVTSSDEALVMLLMENCGQRFPYLASLPRQKYTQKELAKQAKHKLYQSAYSNSKAGSIKWGGWGPDGRKRFSELMLSIRAARRKKGVRELELGILKEIQKDLDLDKRKDNKRKAPPFASFTSDDEPLIPVCCESDDEFFNNEDLPKKKLTPFSGKYRAIRKNNQEVTDKKKEDDDSTDDEDEKTKTSEDDSDDDGGKKKSGKDDSEEEDGGENGEEED